MKHLIQFFLCLLLLSNLAFSLEFDKIHSTIQTNIDATLEILRTMPKQDSSQYETDIQQATNAIFTLFDPVFDYILMAKLALSQHYKSLTQEQIDAFHVSFINNLKKNFTDKLKLYSNQDIQVLDGESPKKNRYNLKTSIIANGKANSIVFKFYENQQDWKVYDVDILGISVIQTYRTQINDILEKSDFNTLLSRLQNEIAFTQ